MAENPRIERLLNVIQELAAGNYKVDTEPDGTYDSIDGVMVGLGMLAEELTASTVSINEYQEKLDALERAMAEVQRLSGLLPMCAWCRKVRDDEGYWQQLEQYVTQHSDTRITHGICPSCKENLSG